MIVEKPLESPAIQHRHEIVATIRKITEQETFYAYKGKKWHDLERQDAMIDFVRYQEKRERRGWSQNGVDYIIRGGKKLYNLDGDDSIPPGQRRRYSAK